MSEQQHIQYITHDNIDPAKWDHCIDAASNGLIYAYSFYLDHMSQHWDALVLGNYETVMPLPWNRKYGIHYLYQPFLAAQLGVFGHGITEQLVQSFIDAIPAKFKLVELSLNSQNNFTNPKDIIVSRINYTLDLSKPYDELFKNYRENIQRNIKKAIQVGCTAERDFEVEKVIELAIAQMRGYGKEAGENVNHFRNLYNFLHSQKQAMTYGISLHGKLVSSCVFFFSHNRAYYILVGNHPNGKTIGASHALIDTFIKDHAGKNMILDFEGSDIRNLAFFYSSFGAVPENYPALRINRLPFYLKWLKK